jgi:hypothetical protein
LGHNGSLNQPSACSGYFSGDLQTFQLLDHTTLDAKAIPVTDIHSPISKFNDQALS